MPEGQIVFDKGGVSLYNINWFEFVLPDSIPSVDLIVTSPPYGVDIMYDEHDDSMPMSRREAWARSWLNRCYDILSEDGRLCLNLPVDVNRPTHFPLSAWYINLAMSVGFQYRTTIIWDKAGGYRKSMTWGSWLSASAPSVITQVEVVIVLYKSIWSKVNKGESDIEKNEFLSWTDGHWKIAPEKASKIGHPAPFPIELPLRCIKLFSYRDDCVLDPFPGSGSTLVAAARCHRKAIGIEISRAYCDIAIRRLEKELVSRTQRIMF